MYSFSTRSINLFEFSTDHRRKAIKNIFKQIFNDNLYESLFLKHYYIIHTWKITSKAITMNNGFYIK